MAAGLSTGEIGMHLLVGAIVMLACVALFFLNVFGGGDAKVIGAASLWIGLPAMTSFVFWMALAGGLLGILLLVLRKMNLNPTREWSKRLLRRETGAPYAVAIAVGALVAAHIRRSWRPESSVSRPDREIHPLANDVNALGPGVLTNL